MKLCSKFSGQFFSCLSRFCSVAANISMLKLEDCRQILLRIVTFIVVAQNG